MIQTDMKRKALWMIVAIFGLNVLAMFFHWYTSMWWFDMLMHFLGGLWLPLFFSVLFSGRVVTWMQQGKHERLFITFLSLVLLVTLLWEGYEFLVQAVLSVSGLADSLDSLSDIALGLSGGTFSIAYIISAYTKRYGG